MATRVTFDASASGKGSGTSIAFSHTVGSGSNRLLIVTTSSETRGPTDITYGSAALTKLASHGTDSGPLSVVQLWYLVAPASGTDTITATFAVNTNAVCGSSSWSGTHQDKPFGQRDKAKGTSTAISVDLIWPGADEVLIDVVATQKFLLPTSLTVGAGQTQLLNTGQGAVRAGSSYMAGEGLATSTMSWTSTANDTSWVIFAVSITPEFKLRSRALCGSGY